LCESFSKSEEEVDGRGVMVATGCTVLVTVPVVGQEVHVKEVGLDWDCTALDFIPEKIQHYYPIYINVFAEN
jgi:hypothetical protein